MTGVLQTKKHGGDSEVLLKPVRVFSDPLMDNGKIVLCENYTAAGEGHPTNHRKWANGMFNTNLELKPWFGLEQEYVMIDRPSGNPVGFVNNPVANKSTRAILL